ncbi:hypothetical protein LJC25_01390 [Bacteroidales bacterium OttesenSCG-928-K03]|nr:hypothetical protein [Odoribacter sp. OttesenSCG-928-L07]MDL2239364.1 hypothetical protein [Bacteroidales bacterium OttesenSCG-928-L14]MDL2240579.1 hypothetical protein [Bacteroidales bacterium OttesenSCG-928-K22]MDL2242360.1 hypothetical protein [Bacteroidales bacterium OttesenSCG-928-K03]
MKKLFSIIAFLFCALLFYGQDSEVLFSPSNDLNLQFNSYIENIGKDFTKEDIQNIKTNFSQIISNNKFNYFFEEQLCNSLNCLKINNTSFPIIKVFISAYLNMLNSNFNEKDCENWTRAICSINPNLQLFNLWEELFANYTVSITSFGKWQVLNSAKMELVYNNDAPHIVFEKGMLTCPLNDSIKIHDCSGKINLISKEFTGIHGFIYWEKAGMNRDSVFAELPATYKLTLDNITITVEAAKLYHKKYFSGNALLGKVTDRCIQGTNEANARYPKFNVYSENPVLIQNIYPNINYFGGFELEGSQIIGSNNKNLDAEITIQHNGKKSVVLKSKHFNLKKDSFAASETNFKLITAKDTISHSNASAKYSLKNNELEIIRDPKKRGGAPFSSTYHKLNIYCDYVNWKLGSDEIRFTSGTSIVKEGKAFFESKNFFSKDRFRQFEAADGTNSIIQLVKFTRKKSDIFYLYEYAEFCKKGEDQVKTSLLLMSNLELLDYDLENDRITVNKKLYDYVAAYSENRDYDIISIFSDVKGIDNAVLDYNTDLLTISGVSKIVFSEKNNVILYPSDNKINVLDELTLEYGGYLQAGLVDFYVQSGTFDYHNFKMKLTQIDSMSFFVNTEELDQYGKPIVSKVNSPIQNLSGILEINKIFNKSGNLDYPEYPIFTCDDFAHIYYDDQDGCYQAYNRDEFYFQVEPFAINNMQDFLPNNLSLEGEFVSAGIFPNFKEKATIMPDLSLGFIHQTPPEGYPMYGGKGKFFNTIVLGNGCLKGQGRIDYITASLKSEDFAIYPDSVIAVVEHLNINELVSTVEYPQVAGNTSTMFWNVNENFMDFNTVSGEPYYFFNNFISLEGNLLYSPEYLKGNGIINKDNGIIISNDFEFKAQSFYADSSHFQLYLPGNKYLAIEVDNYNASLNVNNQSVNFNANNKDSCGLYFKENAYFVEYDKFEWKINENSLILGDKDFQSQILTDSSLNNIINSNVEAYLATSLSKKTDSLQFYTKNGYYDVDAFVLTLSGINYIKISDAAIFPSDGSVKITAGGTMMPVSDGFMIINPENKYHTLYNINLTVESKDILKGSGYYNYVDVTKNVTPIYVESITSNEEQVRGRAVISELSPLLLNPVVEYQGMISMNNTSPELEFNGYYNIKQVCFENKTWIKLDHSIEPNNIILPANESRLSKENKPIYSGLIFSNPGAILYPAFLSSKNKTTDISIFNVEGLLSFNGNIYTISNSTETADLNNINDSIRVSDSASYLNMVRDFPKEYLTLDAQTCTMSGSGKFDFLENPGRISVVAAGDFNYNLMTENITAEVSLFLDFHFNNQALKIMADEIQNSLQITEQQIANEDKYYSALSYLLDEKEFESYYSAISDFGIAQITPKLLQSKIAISNVKLVWNDVDKVFYSEGPITISAINGQVVNKAINGAVEISKFGGTESITLMLVAKNFETQIEENYFFQYHNNNMFTYSTNERFSKLIRTDGNKTRRLKRKGDLPPYQYILDTDERFLSFGF